MLATDMAIYYEVVVYAVSLVSYCFIVTMTTLYLWKFKININVILAVFCLNVFYIAQLWYSDVKEVLLNIFIVKICWPLYIVFIWLVLRCTKNRRDRLL